MNRHDTNLLAIQDNFLSVWVSFCGFIILYELVVHKLKQFMSKLWFVYKCFTITWSVRALFPTPPLPTIITLCRDGDEPPFLAMFWSKNFLQMRKWFKFTQGCATYEKLFMLLAEWWCAGCAPLDGTTPHHHHCVYTQLCRILLMPQRHSVRVSTVHTALLYTSWCTVHTRTSGNVLCLSCNTQYQVVENFIHLKWRSRYSQYCCIRRSFHES